MIKVELLDFISQYGRETLPGLDARQFVACSRLVNLGAKDDRVLVCARIIPEIDLKRSELDVSQLANASALSAQPEEICNF